MGLNQENFAAIGGVSKDTQLNYESGLRKPDSEYLAAIGAAGVDTNYLLHGHPSSDALSDEESELLIGYRKLDIRGRARVLGVIDGIAEPAPAAAPSRVQHVAIHGKVGQQVQGDMHGPVTFNSGGKKK